MKKDFVYHQWPVSDVVKHFETDVALGLSAEKAAFLLKKNGPNALAKRKDVSVLEIFLRQFSNLFILLLFVAGIISYYTAGFEQAFVLFLIIIINITLGFWQEFKAEKSILDLERSYQANTNVIRDNVSQNIENENIVVGDIVELTAGNKVPADLRIIESTSLMIDESTLTGESLPVEKKITPCPIDAVLADRCNMAYAGTLISSGHGKGVVVAVADQTEFGKIAGLIETVEEKTHLEKEVIYLSKILGIIAAVLALVVFALGYFQHLSSWELATFTIALLVGMVPESLPTAITLALSVGVSRMARKKALVRRLAIVETLGSVNIIAADKTGTLTKNTLTLSKIFLDDKSGLNEQKLSSPDKEAIDFLTKGFVCSNVSSRDSVDLAIMQALIKIKDIKKIESNFTKISEVPFSSEKKFMAVTVSIQDKKYLIAKGSVEKIVSFCDLAKDDRTKILDEATSISRSGYKVIALAEKLLDSSHSSALRRLKFQGFFVISDEVSQGVKEAIRKTISAGIRPVMITGDHLETARAIASDIGLAATDNEIITGEMFEQMSLGELAEAIKSVKIFARVTPEDKINIVKAFQKSGYCVAMTGDGTNDAPALHEADVGISMGKRGTDVAKDASDIVLADDHYNTIVSAIEYGRAIQDNIRNVITLLISGNFNEVILIIIAFIFSLPVPFLTLQLLWINMITENFSAITLAFEKPSRSVLRQKPRPVNANSLKSSIKYALCLALVSFVLSLGLYLWGLNFSIAKARTLVFIFIVFLELGYAFSIRNREPFWRNFRGFFENKYLLISAAFITIIQFLIFSAPLAKIFGVVSLTMNEGITVVLFVTFSFFLAEIIKEFVMNRRK